MFKIQAVQQLEMREELNKTKQNKTKQNKTKQNLNELISYKKTKNVLERIRMESLPLYIYGAGNVAIDVKHLLEENNIPIEGVFVDDEYYKENLLLEELVVEKRNYINKNINVIMGQSSYIKGTKKLETENNNIKEIFYITSMIYNKNKTIDYSFFLEHYEEYEKTYNLLEDDFSQKCMAAYMNSRINDDVSYVFACYEGEQNYFSNSVYEINKEEIFIDVGAYTGDTIKQFLEHTANNYNKIYAFEADKRNFELLQESLRELRDTGKIKSFNKACWKENQIITFSSDIEESSVLTDDIEPAMLEEVEAVALDDLIMGLNEKKITMLKVNFYTGTLEVLMGSKNILKQYYPKLAIAIGFDEWGIIRIPQYIKMIAPEYHIFLRYNSSMPARLVCYCIKPN